jgi:hypothetical protein
MTDTTVEDPLTTGIVAELGKHWITKYTGHQAEYRGRWICACGTLLPRLRSGKRLDAAFTGHLAGTIRALLPAPSVTTEWALRRDDQVSFPVSPDAPDAEYWVRRSAGADWGKDAVIVTRTTTTYPTRTTDWTEADT